MHVAEGEGDPLAIGKGLDRVTNAGASPDSVFHRSGHSVADQCRHMDCEWFVIVSLVLRQRSPNLRDGDPIHPGIEFLRITKAFQAPESTNSRFLAYVGGGMWIAQGDQRSAICTRAGPPSERFDRVLIAAFCGEDPFSDFLWSCGFDLSSHVQ